MRMVKIPDKTEEEFDALREKVLKDFPYGLVNSEYSKNQQTGFLYFWDTDYIPPEWEKWIVRPVSKVSDKKGVSEEHE